MNCKPGQLARVVAPYVRPGRGAFVTVERFVGIGDQVLHGRTFLAGSPAWVVSGWVRDNEGIPLGPQLVIADHCLKPIGDLDEDVDEVVERLGAAPRTLTEVRELVS